MKICLIDADSVIPNIPLMKLSTYHKNLGDSVYLIKVKLPYYPTRKKKPFYIEKGYDKYYCSVVFSGNKEFIIGNNIIFGGSGFDLKTDLPNYISNCDNDYSIYPENDISYGFITRGCIRKCKFCIVPEKEGMIRQVSTIDKIIKHKKVKFLDNNILAFDKHEEILLELIVKKIKCQFNQGLDIRLINENNSDLLSKLNYLQEYIFAFDDWKYYSVINTKLKLLNWRKPWQFKFFIYCHPNMELNNIIKRIEYLKSEKCLPYLMRHISCWDSKNNNLYVDLAAWCNQPNIFKYMDFNQFLKKRQISIERKEKNYKLYYNNRE